MLIPMQELNTECRTLFSDLKENQLDHYFEPQPGLFIAESPLVITRSLGAGYEPYAFLVEASEMKGESEALIRQFPQVPAYVLSREALASIRGLNLTRGLLCAMHRCTLPKASDLLKEAGRVAVLETVVNPTNLGAIFRSAAALNIDAVLLTRDCADPLYRRASRVSMGNVFSVPWTYFDGAGIDFDVLKEAGFRTAAMALREDSVSIDHPALKAEERLAIIMGSEGPGLEDATIERADYVVRIPMSHGVDSLNVAAASAVAFWELRR